MTTIRLPEFTTVFCPWADDYATARDGFCGACGKRGHAATDPDVRICPACQTLAAAPGDRYCEGCGSAADRSAWASS